MVKEDIFNSRIVLDEFGDAGMVKVKSPKCIDTEYEVNPGSPFQSAYNQAFSLAIASQLPLWFRGQLLYSPNYKEDITDKSGS